MPDLLRFPAAPVNRVVTAEEVRQVGRCAFGLAYPGDAPAPETRCALRAAGRYCATHNPTGQHEPRAGDAAAAQEQQAQPHQSPHQQPQRRPRGANEAGAGVAALSAPPQRVQKPTAAPAGAERAPVCETSAPDFQVEFPKDSGHE